MTFVGLDIEGTRGDIHGRVIQLGVAYSLTHVDMTPIRWPRAELEHHGQWQTEAEAVHGIPKEMCYLQSVVDKADVHALDRWFEGVFRDVYHYEERQLIAVGFNVGGYDLPILRRDMPKMAKFFHYRTLDINSVLFMDAKRQHKDFKEHKDLVIAEAVRRLEAMAYPSHRHNAGYDARMALMCMQVLEEWR